MNYSNIVIKITCKTEDYLDISELKEFQGSLKNRSFEDIEKIVDSISKHGFATPFFVWKDGETNYVLDGHGRLQALKILKSNGVKIPPLPVVFVNCSSKEKAKELLLRMNSQYGKFTKDSVVKFVNGDINIDLANFELPTNNYIFSKLDVEAFSIPSNPNFKGSENPMFTPVFSLDSVVKAEDEKINVNNIARTTMGKYYLSFGKMSFLISESEYNKFKEYYDFYVEKNGTDKGVIYELFKNFN